MKKFYWCIFFMLLFVSPAYSFKIKDAEVGNSLDYFYNHEGAPYRFTWIGNWKYKHLFFFKPIYRADYTRGLNDTSFYIFTPDFGVYIYKDIALRFQYESKRYHTPKRIFSNEVERVGLSFEAKGSFFEKKLTWYNDMQLFAYETVGGQRLRDVLKMRYGKWGFNTINHVDFDGWDYMDISTFSYSIYKDKNMDIALKFQFQKQKKKNKVFRIGMGIEF